jgi:hypothetical protein
VIGQFLLKRVVRSVESVGNDGMGLVPGVFYTLRNDVRDTVCLVVDIMHVVSNNHPGHLAQVVFDPVGASGYGK